MTPMHRALLIRLLLVLLLGSIGLGVWWWQQPPEPGSAAASDLPAERPPPN
ncbi:MAG: hypothetical protein KDI48_15060 [Xanthomonadales bacterium]|nr:hypothetical protein [Xanthomonadales bacterium]